MSERSQREQVRQALLDGRALTFLDGLREFGCARLGARVWELKREGMDIVSEMVEVGDGKHVARYRLARKPEQMRMMA